MTELELGLQKRMKEQFLCDRLHIQTGTQCLEAIHFVHSLLFVSGASDSVDDATAVAISVWQL